MEQVLPTALPIINGGGVYVKGAFHMEGGEISGNGFLDGTRGGGVYVYAGAEFEMSGGKISDNIASNNSSNYGGGVYVYGSSSDSTVFTMSGGEISGNGSCSGSGVYLYSYSEFNMTGGSISDNYFTYDGSTGGYGGGVYVNSNSVFNMSDGEISGNSAKNRAGGVYVYGTFNMTDGRITDNTAPYGSGVYVYATFSMTGGKISGNAATDSSTGGGGVYVYSTSTRKAAFTMSGGQISGNTSVAPGAGVCLSTYATFNLSGDSQISDNTSDVEDDDVYLGTYAVITLAGELGEEVNIGIRTQQIPSADNDIEITAAESDTNYYQEALQHFTSSMGDDYDIRISDGGYLVMYYVPAPVIVTQPQETSYEQNEAAAALTVEATVKEGGSLSYQWYVSSSNSVSKGTAIDGATETSYVPATDTVGTLYYYCVVTKTVTDEDGEETLLSVTSNIVRVSIYTCSSEEDALLSVSVGSDVSYFSTIEEACAYILRWDEPVAFTLLDDCELSETLEIEQGKSVTLDLAGHDLIAAENITVSNILTVNGVLVLTDSSEAATGNVSGGYRGVIVSGTFQMDGGTISGNQGNNGCGVYLSNGSVFTMNGGSITGNNAGSNSGGGVYISGATFTMNGGEISGNTAANGGGIYIYSYSECYLNAGVVTGNYASKLGGGVYNYGYNTGSVFEMNGGEVSDNTAATSGGGLYLYMGSDFKMTAGKINGNTSAAGGGVYIYGAGNHKNSFVMSGGEINDNMADGNGGGIWMSYTDFTMSNGRIYGNSAATGGGVYINNLDSNQAFTLSGTPVISNNTADSASDNLYMNSGTKITLSGEFQEGAAVGVTTETEPTEGSPVQITVAEDGTSYYESALAYFTSDAGYDVLASDGGYLVLSNEPLYTGLAKDEESSEWLYYTDGAFDSTYTGMAKLDGIWYYVADGRLDWTYTGMVKYSENGLWYYFADGQLDWTYTGLVEYPANGMWYYFVNGQIDWSYTGDE